MSKPVSGLFKGTNVKILEHFKTSPRNIPTQNLRHVKKFAERMAEDLAKISNTQRSKFNTATVVYDEKNDKYYYGMNKGIFKNGAEKNTILFGDNTHTGILPRESLNNYKIGNCSEVDAINNALNGGARLEDLHITTIHASANRMGESKAACQNCTYSFKGRVKRNYTGWYTEENNNE